MNAPCIHPSSAPEVVRVSTRLNIGCGSRLLPGFVNLDLEAGADRRLDVTHGLPWDDGSVDAIYSEHFIEHVSQADALHLLIECRRVLAPGGRLRIATPDLEAVVEDYRSRHVHPDWQRFGYDWVANRCERLNMALRWWGHRWLYDEEELRRLAGMAGLRCLGRCAFGESEDPRLAGLEHRQGSRLILEFDVPARTLPAMPLVSIVIPAYNPAYFDAALASALAQTHPALEIVICDDDTSGRIGAIVAARAGADPRVRHLRNPGRLGGRPNLLRGFEEARGVLVKPLNDDDLLAPGCVARMVEALRRCPQATLVSSRRQPIDADGRPLPDIDETLPPVPADRVCDGLALGTLLLASGRNFVGEPSTVMFRKADLAGLAPDPMSFDGRPIRAVNDIALWLNLLLRGPCVYLAGPLSSFRRHPAQRQHEPEVAALAAEGFGVMRFAWERFELDRTAHPRHLRVRPLDAAAPPAWHEVAHYELRHAFPARDSAYRAPLTPPTAVAAVTPAPAAPPVPAVVAPVPVPAVVAVPAARSASLASLAGFRALQAQEAAEEAARRAFEQALAAGGGGVLAGVCGACDAPARFSFAPPAAGLPNWRESLVCPGCGLANRVRAAFDVLLGLPLPAQPALYLTERVTPAWRWLSARYADVTGSEYLAGAAPGASVHGVRHEDLTALSFADARFDAILSFDVLEHIADHRRALAECRRCLRPGGWLLFTVPFAAGAQAHRELARALGDGLIEHFHAPEYHGDPVGQGRGVLCYRHFGWELLDELRAAGFSEAAALFYWSAERGYLGDTQCVFVACA